MILGGLGYVAVLVRDVRTVAACRRAARFCLGMVLRCIKSLGADAKVLGIEGVVYTLASGIFPAYIFLVALFLDRFIFCA